MSLPLRKQVISRAYQLIEDPNHWTTFALARDASGAACLQNQKMLCVSAPAAPCIVLHATSVLTDPPPYLRLSPGLSPGSLL
jgi:hypothetical protein